MVFHIYPTVIFMKKEKVTAKKESFNKITVCQFIVCVFLLLAIFVFRNGDVKSDYIKLMSYSITKEDFTAIATSVRDYFLNESALKAVFAESKAETETTEKKSEEAEKEAGETENASGGEDIDKKKVPSNCSFESPELETEMQKPVENFRYTSYYGYRVNPITKKRGFHTGIDMAAEEGTKIRAVLDGKVTKTGEDSRAGKYIYLLHENGLTTLYCHCSEILAEKGAVIRQGETVALVGSTGMSTGPHLHFEVIQNGVKTDPYPLLENAS